MSDGESSSFAISSSNGVFAFGNNDYGQLGDNTKFTRFFPVKIFVQNSIFRIVARSGYTLAVDTNHDVYLWGINTFGQLGTGNLDQFTTPQSITHFFCSRNDY